MQNIQPLNIDVNLPTREYLVMKQGDTLSRYIQITLTGCNLTGQSVKIYIEKPDGTKIFNDCTITDASNGVILVEMTSQALAVPGKLECQLEIIGADNSLLSSFSFFIHVEKTIVDGEALESSDEFGALTLALAEVTGYNTRLDGIDLDLADKTKKLISFVSVLSYGADRSGVSDSTQAIKDAIAYAKTSIINSNLKQFVMVEIPTGHYKVNDEIIIPPYVKLLIDGFTFIEATIPGESVFNISNISGDPTFKPDIPFQDYLKSPCINALRGGLFIKSTLSKQSGTIGIKIGSDTNLGIDYSMSRYSLNDISINGFDVAIQMNPYNNYLGSFTRVTLAQNNTNIRFGDETHTSVTNSGENISFYNCVFGNASVGFDWHTDGFDCNLYGCSLDYMRTTFKPRRGFKKISMFGGHIEGDSESPITIVDGSLNSDNSLTAYYPVFILNGVKILTSNFDLFKGKIRLIVDSIKWLRSTNTLSSFLYCCDSDVIAKEITHTMQAYDIALSSGLNSIYNSKFQATSPLQEYTVTDLQMGTPAVTDSGIPTGSSYTKVLKATAEAGATGAWLNVASSAYPVKPGQVIQAGGVFYIDSDTYREAKFDIRFYDILGNQISATGYYGSQTGAVSRTWNSIFRGSAVVAPAGSATVKMYAQVTGVVEAEVVYVGELFLGIS